MFASDVNCAYCSGETCIHGTIVNNDDDEDGICNDFEGGGGCIDQNAINYNRKLQQMMMGHVPI